MAKKKTRGYDFGFGAVTVSRSCPHACDACRLLADKHPGNATCACGRTVLKLDAMAHANRLIAGYGPKLVAVVDEDDDCPNGHQDEGEDE